MPIVDISGGDKVFIFHNDLSGVFQGTFIIMKNGMSF